MAQGQLPAADGAGRSGPAAPGQDPSHEGVRPAAPPTRQRVAAYGMAWDTDGRLLLVRAAPWLTVAGWWFLPGGGVEHGEEPFDALRREVEEETGLSVESATLLGVLSDTWPIPDGTLLHTVRLIYRIDTWRGALRPEASGSSDDAMWCAPGELRAVPLVRYVREALTRYAGAP